MNEKYTIEELEAYLFGELTSGRKREIEDEIQRDQALREELDALKISREAIELAGWKSLITKNQEIFLAARADDKVKPLHSKPLSTSIWLGRIAASLTLVLVGLVAILFFSVSPESITSKQLDYSIPVLRSADSNLEEIEKAYQSGNFDQVLTLGSSLSSFDPKAFFLIGLAHLEKGNGASAEKIFTEIESDNLQKSESNYADQLDYYSIEALLLQEKFEEAEKRMKKILDDPNHTYHHNFSRFDLFRVKILKIK